MVERPINYGFILGEVKRALGKDQVCYTMIRHLTNGALGKLLALFNKVWVEGRLPKTWKAAVVIPVRKPGKDPTELSSYRPIALTSRV